MLLTIIKCVICLIRMLEIIVPNILRSLCLSFHTFVWYLNLLEIAMVVLGFFDANSSFCCSSSTLVKMLLNVYLR